MTTKKPKAIVDNLNNERVATLYETKPINSQIELERFSVRLDFDTTGYITIKRFEKEDSKMFLKRVTKIIKIFLKEKKEMKNEKTKSNSR